nr:tripartite tricarboxylate transporter permease [Roseospira visakhapatnamensis]
MLAFAVAGLVVGAIPGLTATLGVALLVPATLTLDPVPALAGLMTLAATAIFAGDLPGALLRIPGTPASAAYVDAAHALSRQGQAGRALGLGLLCAALGGVAGALALLTLAPVLARLALCLSTVEVFWLALLGLSAAALVARAHPLKGAVSLLVGLALGCVGLDPVSGHPRLTGGLEALSGGVGVIPVMIGLFALPEVARGIGTRAAPRGLPGMAPGWGAAVARDLWRQRGRIAVGCGLGTVVGAVPGAGADIAAYLARAVTDHGGGGAARDPGDAEAAVIAPAGAANNAAIGGALVPATVVGIPGDSLTAVVIGAMTLHGLTPGPTVFLVQPERITAVVLAFLLANLMLVPVGLLAIRSARVVMRVPRAVLAPIILVVCLVGAYAVGGTPEAVVVMLAAGLLGIALEAAGLPLAPLVLGLVLGPTVEETLLVSLLKAGGDPAILVSRPGAVALATLTLGLWGAGLGMTARRHRRS